MMRGKWVAAGVALLLVGARWAGAHDEALSVPRVADAELHRPATMPDRVVLSWTGDPATSQAVTWRTRPGIPRGVAQIGLASDGPQRTNRECVAVTRDLETDLGPARYHTVEFSDLEPGTVYAYRVGDGINWTEWFQFRTAGAQGDPFRFVYFGDAQNDIRTHWSRVVREAFREAPRAAFTLHAGDLVNRGARDAEWGEWFGAPGWVNGEVPVVPVPGNHEYLSRKGASSDVRLWDTRDSASVVVRATREERKNEEGSVEGTRVTVTSLDGRVGSLWLDTGGRVVASDAGIDALTGFEPAALLGRKLDGPPLHDRPAAPPVRELTPHWRAQFALPTNGPDGLEESAYFFDYQGARIVCLNSNERLEVQAGWLRGVLARNPQRWTLLAFHHPVFSPAKSRDNPVLRGLWKPILDEFRVDLVLTGHDHTYARSGDVNGRGPIASTNVAEGYRQVYDPAVGTVYVVSVSGPKMYAQSATEWAVRRAEDVQLFQVIAIEGSELRYEARTAAGRVYDAFRLIKRPGAPNRLIEVLPPESRRPIPPPEESKGAGGSGGTGAGADSKPAPGSASAGAVPVR